MTWSCLTLHQTTGLLTSILSAQTATLSLFLLFYCRGLQVFSFTCCAILLNGDNWELNPRPSAWKTDDLTLSHTVPVGFNSHKKSDIKRGNFQVERAGLRRWETIPAHWSVTSIYTAVFSCIPSDGTWACCPKKSEMGTSPKSCLCLFRSLMLQLWSGPQMMNLEVLRFKGSHCKGARFFSCLVSLSDL